MSAKINQICQVIQKALGLQYYPIVGSIAADDAA